MKVIISGGGTGGHIFPAISIANGIKEKEPEAEILFVGAIGRMEMEKVPAAGYEIKGIPARGLKRPLYSPRNIVAAVDYLRCLAAAGRIIKKFRPDLVVGVGGYASAAMVRAAAKAGIPVLLQEQNSFAGLVNRKNGRYASRICVAYEKMERFFSKEKILLTGNPVRKDITRPTVAQRKEGYEYYNLDPNRKTLFIVGGSLGCKTLNECMKKEISSGRMFGKESGIQVIWQCGKYYKPDIDAFMATNKNENIYYSDFIKRMDLAYAIADVVVSRAGAGTISELCIAGKCTIFVPSPVVAEDHQTHNAMALVAKGAAIMVKDNQAEELLMEEIMRLMNDPDRITELENKISAMAKPDAADMIAEECIKLAKR